MLSAQKFYENSSLMDKEELTPLLNIMREFYKTKDGICYLWIFSSTRKGKRSESGKPFIIPIEEVECYHCGSCE